MDESIFEAARDLGASPWRTFRQVTLPLILPAVLAGFLMSLHSLDRRFRDHLLCCRCRRHHPAAADLLDDQGGGDPGSQCRLDPADGADPDADRRWPRGCAPDTLKGGHEAHSALLCALLCLVSLAHAEDVLYLYNWNNYLSEETVGRFEPQCHCRLKQDFYSDNEEMLAKLEAGASGYDLIVPTGNAVETLIRQQALRPLDKTKLPNLKNLKAAFLDPWYDPGNALLGALRHDRHADRLQRRADSPNWICRPTPGR